MTQESASNAPSRTCTKCNKQFPATVEFFHKARLGLYGLGSWCKSCDNIHGRAYSKTKRGRRLHRIGAAKHRQKIRDNPPPLPPPGTMKKCTLCKRELPATLEFFYRSCNFETGLYSYCRDCKKMLNSNWQKKRKKYISNQSKKRYLENKVEINAKTKQWAAKTRIEVLRHYSRGDPRCACCGEQTNEFLSMDHIKPCRGNRQAGPIYPWLKKMGFPEGFQVLCFNCNMAKAYYGQCPHQKK